MMKAFVVITRYLFCRLYLSVKLMFALSIFLTYAIQFYVPVNIIWSFLDEKAKKRGSSLPAYTEYALRFTLVLLTCK